MSKCRKYRVDVALLVGNDLEASARLTVERHLATCPDCRFHRQMLLEGQQVLDQFRAAENPRIADTPRTAIESAAVESTALEESSIWPGLQRQIRVLDDRSSRGLWRGWLPAGAVAAACLAVALISSDLFNSPQFGGEFARQPMVTPGIPVMNTPSNRPTIVPIGAEEFVPRQLPADEQAPAPRRRIDRNQRLNEGLFRGL